MQLNAVKPPLKYNFKLFYVHIFIDHTPLRYQCHERCFGGTETSDRRTRSQMFWVIFDVNSDICRFIIPQVMNQKKLSH